MTLVDDQVLHVVWHGPLRGAVSGRSGGGSLGTLLDGGELGRPVVEVSILSDSTAGHESAGARHPTIGSILEGLEPMGDLSRFVIEDMAPDEEDEFFAVLKDA